MNKPEFITFTGVDEQTPLDDLIALATQYPIEYGVLVSEKRASQPEQVRYPSFAWIANTFLPAMQNPAIKLAAHLCGADAREVVETSRSQWSEFARHFNRIQINVPTPMNMPTPNDVDMLRAAAFGVEVGCQIIFQARGEFPVAGSLPNMLAQWLFDRSGGLGRVPESWPIYRGNKIVGYAGGLNPDNAASIVAILGAQDGTYRYWIDMETGVRTDDRFDIGKCRAVCEAVYGKDYRKA